MSYGSRTWGDERFVDSDCVALDVTITGVWFISKKRRVMDMGVSVIFKIAAVGILVTILSQILKHSGREEHAFLVSLAGLILVLTWIIPYIYDLFETIQTLFSL